MTSTITLIKIIYFVAGTNLNCECLIGKDFLFSSCQSDKISLDISHLYQQKGDRILSYTKAKDGKIHIDTFHINQDTSGGWETSAIIDKIYINTGKQTKYLGLEPYVFEHSVIVEVQRRPIDISYKQLRINSLREILPASTHNNKCLIFLPFYEKIEDSSHDSYPYVIAEWSERYEKKHYTRQVKSISAITMKKIEVEEIYSRFGID